MAMNQSGVPDFSGLFDSYRQGAEWKEQSRLRALAEEGRALTGKALAGDQSALTQLGGIDPNAYMNISKFTREQKLARLDELASGAMAADTPEKWAAFVQRAAAQGHKLDPGETRESIIDQAMGWKEKLAQQRDDRNFNASQKNADRSYNLDVQQLNQSRANANQPKYDVTDVGGKRVVMDMRTGQIVRELGASPNTMQPRTSITDIGGKRVLVDENTGDVIKELGESPTKQQSTPTGYQARSDGKPGIERIPGWKDVDLEGKLRTEFQGQTKDFRDVRDSYNRIRASAQNPTPAGDIALIYNYMKMLDPSSVVRESEFATAANAAPFLTRVGIDPEKVKSIWEGKKLVPEVRADFLNRAQSLYGQQEQTFKTLADQYRAVATKNQLDPETIILTPTAPPDAQQGNVGALKQKYGLE